MPPPPPSRSTTLIPLALVLVASLLSSACAEKGETLVGVDRRSYETLILPQRRALDLPPRYNLDGGAKARTRPGASFSSSISLESLQQGGEKLQGADAALLKRLGSRPEPDIRRKLSEDTLAPVPLPESMVKELLNR